MYDGLKIAYYLPYASTSTAVTLNLTLSNGTATGAINCYYNSSTRLTTHYSVGTLIFLTYYSAGSVSVSGTATTDNRWMSAADYNTDAMARNIAYYNNVKAKTALTAEKIIVGDSSGYSVIASGVTFDLSYPILWTTAAVSSGSANYANMYSQVYDRNLTNVKSGFSGAANSGIYLITTISGNTATVDANLITDTLPSTEDGKVYIRIGKLGSQSTGANYFFFEPVHPMFWYKNGSLQPYSPDSGSGTDTWRNVKVDGTEILGTATTTGALDLVKGNGLELTNSSGAVTFKNKAGIYNVIGTQTAATASWTGNIAVDALYNGLTINYFLPYAGVSSTNVTLNLTLADGTTTTGAKNVYLSTVRLTTHYGAGRVIQMTYYSAGAISISGTATTDDRWVCDAYYDTNTFYSICRNYTIIKAGAVGIFKYTFILENSDGRWESIVTSSSTGTGKSRNTHGFKIDDFMLMYANKNFTENQSPDGSSCFIYYTPLVDARYSFNVANNATYGFTAGEHVYLVGTINSTDGLFYLDTTWWTQTLPNTADGKIYIHLGLAFDYYRMIFTQDRSMFQYVNGKLRHYIQDTSINGYTIEKSVPSNAEFTDTTYTGGTGISIGTGNAINHSNSVTAQTTQKVYPIKIDAQGHISAYGTSPTTLSGYGITDANISSGVITLGSNTITPLTSASTLDATKLSGTIPSGCYTDQNVAQAANASNNNNYELLFEDTAGSGTVTSGTRKSSHLTYNPSTSVFTIGDTAPSNGTITVSNVTTSKINSVTLPATPKFTDQAVQQLSGGNNVDYQVLFEDTSGSGEVTSGTRKHSGLVYNPNTSTLTSTNVSATSISSTSLAATTITGSTLNGQTIPASPVFTDQAVQQLEGGNNTAYELLYEDTASSGDTTSGTRKSQNLTYNPVSNTLTLAGKVDCTSMSVTTPTYTLNKTSGTWNVGSVSAKRTGNVVQMTIIVKGTGTGVTCGTDGFVGSLTGTGPAPAQDMTLVSYTGNFTIMGYIDTSRKIWIRPIGSGTYTAGNNSSIQVDGVFICE